MLSAVSLYIFFFNDTATTEIYTLSLHDALPIYQGAAHAGPQQPRRAAVLAVPARLGGRHARSVGGQDPREHGDRSEEHTSELQSRQYLVCRLLLEKKKKHVSTLQLKIVQTQ